MYGSRRGGQDRLIEVIGLTLVAVILSMELDPGLTDAHPVTRPVAAQLGARTRMTVQ